MAIELEAGYYLRNFQQLIDYVFDLHNDLLSAEEKQFYDQFRALPQDAQKLYVRMLTRKGSLFRHNKLRYNEITDIASAALHLADAKFIAIDPPIQVEDLLSLFSKTEWIEILRSAGHFEIEPEKLKVANRADFDQQLLEVNQLYALQTAISEPLYQLQNADLFDVYRLLYFGNLRQDLTEFVLRDMGLLRYENYRIDCETRLFEKREQLESHLDYYAHTENFEEILAGNAMQLLELHQALTDDQSDSLLHRRVQRVRLQIARQLERLEEQEKAREVYDYCEQHPSRERQARIWAKLGYRETALQLCRDIAMAPRCDEEAEFAAGFGMRLARKLSITWPQDTAVLPREDRVRLPATDQSVELAACEFLRQEGECHFVENALICGIFGLNYWDVFFHPVRGAFTHPFQMRPHDLYEDDFLLKRKAVFDQANDRVKDTSVLTEYVLGKYAEKYGKGCSFVMWGALETRLIKTALHRIPGQHWLSIFDRLWKDPKANSSGFPDLIFFPAAGGYELVEVKGPGDRIQKNQARWMKYFHHNQIPHRVLHVEWQ